MTETQAKESEATPLNIEAEQALLGILMYDNEAFYQFENLESGHFYEPLHARLFAVIATRITAGQLAEPITIDGALTGDAAYVELGGLRYLADLVDSAPPSRNGPEYATQIIDTAIRRELLKLSGETKARATDYSATAREQLEAIEGVLFDLAETKRDAHGFQSFSDALDGALAIAEAAAAHAGEVSGLSTGLIDMDSRLGGLHPSALLILAARPAMGKEQPVDCGVLTPTGWRTMGSLAVGDEVIGSSGRPVKVIGVYPQGVKQAYRVTFRDMTSTECGEEHLWAVNPSFGRKRHQRQVMTLKQMIVGGVSRPRGGRTHAKWRIPLVEPVEYAPCAQLRIPPYVLGVLIGDGSLSGSDLRFSNHDQDADIRGRVAALMPDIHLAENRSGACPYFDMRGPGKKNLAAALQSYGLRVRSAEKAIPEAYMFASANDRFALLRGLMDTDGSCSNTGSAVFHTISPVLAEQFGALARSLGALAMVRRYDRTAQGKPVEFQVRIRASFCPFLTARKAASWRPVEVSRYIWKVERSRVTEQVCIQVDAPDSLYVTDNYIVTHNTALATSIAFNIAKTFEAKALPDGTITAARGGRVGFFSLEMSKEELAGRILSDVSGVSGDKIRKGEIDAMQFSRYRDAAKLLRSIPLHIDETGGLRIDKLCARARRLKRTKGLDVLFVDYLQLAQGTEKTKGNRVQEIGEITGALKALAKELKIPVVALSQLSRQVESRDDKRPKLSDLRESGSIEQDADVVMFIYREAYYLENAEPKENTPEHMTWQENMDQARGVAEVIVSKQRHGPTGTVRLHFDGATTKFTNLAREQTDYARSAGLHYSEN